MSYTLLLGDCVQVMRTLPANSCQVCVTSPPYLNLRSYLADDHPDKDKEIGTEQSLAEYIGKLVDVFREVRRLLHPSGVLFLNIGDSYNGSGGAGGDYNEGGLKEGQPKYRGSRIAELKQKDLLGVPWELAFALRADGWWLRSEIIWHKKAPMPESVTDRPTKAHEQVFLLSKSATYFYDAEAIREPVSESSLKIHGSETVKPRAGEWKIEGNFSRNNGGVSDKGLVNGPSRDLSGRNKRSVWTLGPESYAGAHFAVMPSKLVEPCILAGSSAYGCCEKCLAPWERVVERVGERETHGVNKVADDARGHEPMRTNGTRHGSTSVMSTGVVAVKETTGWQPTCACNAAVVPCTVLDPFNGAATVGVVALKHHRNYIGIDLNADYLELSEKRLNQSQPMLEGLFA